MYILHKIQTFLNREDGAITVDWVVLTAGVIGLVVIGAAATMQGVEAASSTISTSLATKTVDID